MVMLAFKLTKHSRGGNLSSGKRRGGRRKERRRGRGRGEERGAGERAERGGVMLLF